MKMYAFLLLTSLFSVHQVHSQTAERINLAKQLIKDAINVRPNLGPGFVRLAFHDCVGGCDGCINLCQPGNAGLRQYTEALELMWTDNGFNTDFSRADFWILASVAALERAVLIPGGGGGGGGRGGGGGGGRGRGRKRRSTFDDEKEKENEIEEQLNDIMQELKDMEGALKDMRVKKDPRRGGGRGGGGGRGRGSRGGSGGRGGGGGGNNGTGGTGGTGGGDGGSVVDPDSSTGGDGGNTVGGTGGTGGATGSERDKRTVVGPVTVGGLTLTYRTGRQDCPTSPDSTTEDKLPNSAGALDEHIAWFKNEFPGITSREMTALMGAHTLGRAHPEHSGYDGPWVANENRLDNQYFRDILIPWRQVERPPQPPLDGCPNPTFTVSGNPLFQWIGPGDRMMLNADMALAFDIENNDANFDANNGRSTCDAVRGRRPLCSTDTETRQAVEDFAADNAQWLREFSAVYQKLIDH